MSDRTWRKGPPPHVGWWNASPARSENAWRWWDGSQWSWASFDDEDENFAAIRSKDKSTYNTKEIWWSDYYPENARVPRIDPRKA